MCPTLALLLWTSGAMAQTPQPPVHIDAGVSAAFAPRVVFRDEPYTGAYGGLVGTLSLGHAVGQIRFERAASSTFRGADADALLGATSVVGSAGYRLGELDRLSVDFLVTAGVAWLGYESNGNDWADVSPQLGATVAPRIVVVDRLVLSLFVRHLGGWDVDPWNSQAIARTDAGIGVQFRIF